MKVFKAGPATALAIIALAATAIAGCGGGSSTSTSKSGSGSAGASKRSSSGTINAGGVDKAAAAQVPSSLKSKGSMTVAADASYPPNEFIQPGTSTVVGMDADLAHAIGQVLGVKANVQNVTFDAILPGMASGKYDLGMSSFTDTKAREKVVNFVTYFSAGTSFYTKAQGGTNVTGLADLCGKTVAVEKGTTQQNDATAQSAKCKAAGKPAVNVLTYPDQNGANLALSSGRAQLVMADSPPAEYAVKQSGGKFKITGKTYGTAPYGIAVPKSLGSMDNAVLAAVKTLMSRGTYKQILDKWGIAEGAITTPVINGAVS
jgi:polar amino acid transport system substrate-binding protein